MGQYFYGVILNRKRGANQTPKAYFDSHSFNSFSKLMEHSYIGNSFVNAFMNYLIDNGKQYVLWAGDYVDEEPNKDYNIYHDCYNKEHLKINGYNSKMPTERFIVNHTKHQFVDLGKVKEDKYGCRINPLPLLCSEGNGNGGGDYFGKNFILCGSWARNLVSVSNVNPSIKDKRYKEIVPSFMEK